jgi:prepilin-type N-terminal cleavage/methylation domain-containing protein
MNHDNTHYNEDGFTLLELIVVILFASILVAISAPSFSALNRRNKVTQDLTSAKNALLEAQRSAIRRGQNCALLFSYDTLPDPEPAPKISTTSGNCLSTGTGKLYNVSMQVSTNNTSLVNITGSNTANLTFDYLGQITATNPITIVLQHESNTGDKKCMVVSQPLGLIATGKYTGTSSTDISSNCTP